MLEDSSKEGVVISAIYSCIHKFDENCFCRKPNSGLIVKAAIDYGLDPKNPADGSEDKDGDEGIRWDKLATGCDTLVFLMGIGNLPSIVNNLVRNGRDPLEPVALIQWGTTPDQRSLIGNLSNIVEKASQANFNPPAITVVGKVASLGEKLEWFGKKPLSGKRVMITRPRHQAKKMR